MTDERTARIAAAQKRMAELAQLFLDRTLHEIGVMRAGLTQLNAGEPQALQQIQHFAHKIRGTGATLGFDAVSDRGGEIETLAIEGATGDAEDPEYVERLRLALDALNREVDALKNRSVTS
jgi:chemotaxis protein histidine kinase CheA